MLRDRVTKRSVQWSDLLRSGERIFIGSNASTPSAMIDHLIANAGPLRDIEVCHLLCLPENRWAYQENSKLFKVNSFFLSGATRDAVAEGRADYTPCFLSEIPRLFNEGVLPLDAALIMVSPPDEYGYCSLGVSVDINIAAVRSARLVIAQINPKMPRSNGHSFIHLEQIDAIFEAEQELPTIPSVELDQVTEQIGQYVSLLVKDGSTLQLGIGKIPDAVLRYLGNHRDLGVHSEMISDGVIELMKKNVINNRKKTFHRGKTITTFVIGSRKLYDFVDGNPHIEFYPSEHVNSPVNIARNDNMVSINSAIEVDVTGQVVADSIGYRFYSGIGGQVDFIRGAALSKNGIPIIALPSTTRDGQISKIVAKLTEGSGVVTSRGDVHYVVTEYGIAYLRGKSIRERALELIRIAHPKFRQQLLESVRKHYWVPEYQEQTPTNVPELGALDIKPMTFDGEEMYLRPLYPADERKLQEFFYSHNKETLLMRYNHTVTELSREKSCNLVSVDQQKDLALCLIKRIDDGEQIEGVGRYYFNRQDNSCEVAFVVKESQRGKGMAKALLNEMINIAKSRRLSKMQAYVRPDNRPMLKVFEHYGFQQRLDGDVDEIYLVLEL
ncbi:GNAT family N-acetyltransferase [Pleionea litopenaei]|uniref:GNAT family N-acetyltransferase n=1 Tax=Pleionea litopenaei TaxID=3070815 RepID=A0AA51RVY2_9GAMM|nr:GNAT family N-acetyltransferase [Pleionea sp. HL-JVS1]WMS88454.1 GNAT family N-acetyltransferase [Pleionea sp. HL-JVS1]